MSELNQTIDYNGFRGAGGPAAPPPQRPNTNPTRQRILLLVITPFLITIVILIFREPFVSVGTFTSHIISALCAGIYIALHDWIIEAYAYQKGLWFCYGGYQKIGRLDFKHVPIDMVIGFIGTGFNLAILTYFPELLRSWGWVFWPINDPSLDIWLVPGFLVLISLGGAFIDFRSKRAGVWMNGPIWSYWKCAFIAWLPLLGFGIIVDRVTFYLLPNPLLLSVVLTGIFGIMAIIVIILIKKY